MYRIHSDGRLRNFRRVLSLIILTTFRPFYLWAWRATHKWERKKNEEWRRFNYYVSEQEYPVLSKLKKCFSRLKEKKKKSIGDDGTLEIKKENVMQFKCFQDRSQERTMDGKCKEQIEEHIMLGDETTTSNNMKKNSKTISNAIGPYTLTYAQAKRALLFSLFVLLFVCAATVPPCTLSITFDYGAKRR